MAARTGGELIQDFLSTYEIPYVFGNPGTTETTFLAAISASKATYVLSLHEFERRRHRCRLRAHHRQAVHCQPAHLSGIGQWHVQHA